LVGELSIEWSNYCRELQVAGVILTGDEDELFWTGGDSSGVISVKNIYEAIQSTQNLPLITGWKIRLWKWDIPLKIKLFLWLAVNNKIATWDNLLHRGWSGPGRCILCKKETEDCNHLFIICSFTRAVWETLKRHTKGVYCWSGNNLGECFSNWTEAKSSNLSLAALTCWNIWIARNEAIFEGKMPSVSFSSYKNYEQL
jgi:hypothetical protein